MTPDGELLRRYAEAQSEDAFVEVVNRYIALVYSAALRQVNGDAALAQDVTQNVFADLGRKARAVAGRRSVAGWLYTSTHFAAAKAVRTEQRRHAREREAQTMHELMQSSSPDPDWEQIKPVLDDVMHQLKEDDREAILLRYFENRPFLEIGERIGLTENAARMRIERALEKLRALLSRRGITTGAALSLALSSRAVETVPAGVVSAVANASLAGVAGAGKATTTLIQLIAMAKAKTTILGAVMIGCLVAPLLVQHRAAALSRQQKETYQTRNEAIATLTADTERLAGIIARRTRTQRDMTELQELRAEAQAVAPRARAVAALRRENQTLRASIEKPKDPLQIKEEIIATELQLRDWLIAFHHFAERNHGQFPIDFEVARPYLPADAAANGAASLNDFEIVYRGSSDTLQRPGEVIVIQQRQARAPVPGNGRKGTWAKIYGFADGSVRLHQEADGNFEPFEREHSPSPAAQPQQQALNP